MTWIAAAVGFPLAAFAVLGVFGRRIPDRGVALIGTGAVALAAIATGSVFASFVAHVPDDGVSRVELWHWLVVGGLSLGLTLRVDALSLVMASIVTGVGFLILLYSTDFMRGEEGYSRFFAYMSLFIASMLALVLADNLLFLYLGWEGVGLSSYLLIGFWYRDPKNGHAAQKAFIITRIGDAALAVGIFLIFTELGTLQIDEIATRASAQWAVGAPVANAAAALLLTGAVAKSAQLPFQTWLPDAMAGPTPVSALIHAATMVTAGVFLIARMHALFTLAPIVMMTVGVIGAVTLLVSGIAALAQRDIKRVLAYSTISQLGYMFVALGVGAWTAAIFHLMVHAFFKALLFLGAGVVILALDHEHDLLEMGGLRRELPVTFWTFLAASAALAGFPIVTAGFYSKDLILDNEWMAGGVARWLYAAGLVGTFLSAAYIFRAVFLAFFGEQKRTVMRRPKLAMRIPLAVLGVLSIVGGLVETPRTFGDFHLLSHLLALTFGERAGPALSTGTMTALEAAAAAACFLGIGVAWLSFGRTAKRARTWPGVPAALERAMAVGLGFDWLYAHIIVRPFRALTTVVAGDPIDQIYRGIEMTARAAHLVLTRTQTGRVRSYAAAVALGAVFVVAVVMVFS